MRCLRGQSDAAEKLTLDYSGAEPFEKLAKNPQ